MHDLVFESTRTVTPKEFAEFVATREAAGDTGHYELLNGRVVMSPPAGYPHVLECWLVDPRAEEVTVFHAVAGCFDAGCAYAVNDRLSSQVLAGLTIDVRDLMPLP